MVHPSQKMELTPVKIPRKRRDRQDPQELSDAAPTKKKKSSQGERIFSLLETMLPAEVVQLIYLYSLCSENLNLPRSSPRLGLILSNRFILIETMIAVFGPTWELWYSARIPIVYSYHGWLRDYEHFGGNPDFQVSCRESYSPTDPLPR